VSQACGQQQCPDPWPHQSCCHAQISVGDGGLAQGDIDSTTDSATEAQLTGIERETQELLLIAAAWREKTARLRNLHRDAAVSQILGETSSRGCGQVSATTV